MNRTYRPPGIIMKLLAGVLASLTIIAVLGIGYVADGQVPSLLHIGALVNLDPLLKEGLEINLKISLILIMPMSIFADAVALHVSRWGMILRGITSFILYLAVGMIAVFLYSIFTGEHYLRQEKTVYFIILTTLYWLYQWLLWGLSRVLGLIQLFVKNKDASV
ncbi:hypothetical protein [Paenibacillus aquistagni]|uniref:hypothetical protein n=1 Tax=Paenibacillus aquistagni TaxID=1852522 RepID=UPI000B50D45C|nr:hypothetical protein [Paenibacillus aquistagni]